MRIFATLVIWCLMLLPHGAFVNLASCADQDVDFTYPINDNCWSRNEIIEIVEHLNLTSGAEVGVQVGHFSRTVLSIWKKAKFYAMIDLWRAQANYSDAANVDNAKQEKNYAEARDAVTEFGSVARLYRNSSLDVASVVADASLDFVYLDARHDYCGVSDDLQAWWPKLKIGGIMAGHDFLTAAEAQRLSRNSGGEKNHWEVCENGTIMPRAVKGAVHDFACVVRVKIFHTREKPSSWYFSPKRLRHIPRGPSPVIP